MPEHQWRLARVHREQRAHDSCSDSILRLSASSAASASASARA
jgi:hypothetical protein